MLADWFIEVGEWTGEVPLPVCPFVFLLSMKIVFLFLFSSIETAKKAW